MNKLIISIVCVVCVCVIGLTLVTMYFSYSNAEIRLRNTIVAKQTDNKNEMDAMWKTISQTASVAEKDRSSLMEIFNGYAQGRSGVGDNQAIVKWVKEAVPNVDNSLFKQLMNIIVAQRDGFKMRQKELLDLSREHNNCLTLFPSSIICGGRPPINIVIVTSTRTEDAFKSGKDDDTDLFNKK